MKRRGKRKVRLLKKIQCSYKDLRDGIQQQIRRYRSYLYGRSSMSWYHASFVTCQEPACWCLGAWYKLEDSVVVQLALISVLLLLCGGYWVYFLQRLFGSAFIYKESSLRVLRLFCNVNQTAVHGDGDILKGQPQL